MHTLGRFILEHPDLRTQRHRESEKTSGPVLRQDSCPACQALWAAPGAGQRAAFLPGIFGAGSPGGGAEGLRGPQPEPPACSQEGGGGPLPARTGVLRADGADWQSGWLSG